MSGLSALPFHLADEIEVPAAELNRLLGYTGNGQPSGKEAQLVEWAIDWYRRSGKPVVLSHRLAIAKEGISDHHISLVSGHYLTSTVLAQRFREGQVHEVIVFGVSAGEQLTGQVTELWAQSYPDKAYFLDIYGSAVTEQMARSLGLHWCQEAQNQKMALLPHYSPGYDGWDLADQTVLLDLLKTRQENPPKITLTEGGMLRPAKSQLGVFGLSRDWNQATQLNKYVPCRHCSLDGCVFRRAAYQPEKPRPFCGNTVITPAKPTYAFSEKILERWAKERLSVTETDGNVRAQFIWEGTTCGNLGQPMQILYDVKLNHQSAEYRIIEKTCRPQDGDENYRQMCAYKKEGPDFLKQMAEHDALLGQPLNDALAWNPDILPAGCQCTMALQSHKWKIVLQTLHYRLYHM